ncbi:hypothetical protein F4859DRAFT_344311 [Xylaria cf. heliscus]|nr:hypothetical protein F4859DRAFT_344311 [Xylaria cf. heliscus]
MAFTPINNGDGDSGESILKNLRDMVERTDPRGSYYIEPTWRINGVPISECDSPHLSHPAHPTRQVRFDSLERHRKSTFKRWLWELRSSELREIIMNLCLRSLDTHRDVVRILKRMQKKKPRPISIGERVQNPTAGLYLYCRTQQELVDIILEISRYDENGYLKQDVKDLIMVIRQRDRSMGSC